MQSTSLYFNAKVKAVFSFSSSISSSKNALFYRTPCNTNVIAVIGGGRKEEENGRGRVGDGHYNLSREENDTSFSILRSTGNKSTIHLVILSERPTAGMIT